MASKLAVQHRKNSPCGLFFYPPLFFCGGGGTERPPGSRRSWVSKPKHRGAVFGRSASRKQGAAEARLCLAPRCDYVFGRADKSHPRNHRQCRLPTVRAAVRCFGEARHENKIQLLCIAIAAILPTRRQNGAENHKGMQNHAKRLAAITTSLPHKGIPILADSHIIKPIPISDTETLCMTDFSPPDFPFASSEPAVLSLPTIF